MTFGDVLEILYEDNHLIAINKPVGWPSAHFNGVDETLDRVVKDYIREKYDKPGNVFLGVVHRLDKPVSGVLLFARTSKGASRLCEQFRDSSIDKTYWAMVDTDRDIPEAGTLHDWLRKDEDTGIVEVVAPNAPDAQQAVLHYTLVHQTHGQSWLELRPQTGRRHQLRVQLASRGWRIHGDHKYGATSMFAHGIGLHARQLTFLHPTKKEPMSLVADVPRAWMGRFAYLLKGRLT